MKPLFVAIGGILGVFSRYYMGPWVGRFLLPPFPYGTFVINILGAFLIGLVYVLADERALMSPEVRTGIMVGFLGGYTTFSSFCLEGIRLIEDSEYWFAALYVIGSPVAGLLATAAGILLGRLWIGGSVA